MKAGKKLRSCFLEYEFFQLHSFKLHSFEQQLDYLQGVVLTKLLVGGILRPLRIGIKTVNWTAIGMIQSLAIFATELLKAMAKVQAELIVSSIFSAIFKKFC